MQMQAPSTEWLIWWPLPVMTVGIAGAIVWPMTFRSRLALPKMMFVISMTASFTSSLIALAGLPSMFP